MMPSEILVYDSQVVKLEVGIKILITCTIDLHNGFNIFRAVKQNTRDPASSTRQFPFSLRHDSFSHPFILAFDPRTGFSYPSIALRATSSKNIQEPPAGIDNQYDR